MAFLDNSGDIVLDAVLTDAGRQRLARGDGTFKIVQFALGDDEINYGLYDKTNASGSAYYDLSILQTPVLEAFTNNIASLNSKLLTIPRTNYLFLPVIKNQTNLEQGASPQASGFINVLVDKTTQTEQENDINDNTINGFNFDNGNIITFVQGIDNNVLGTGRITNDLRETQYSVELDNRLGRVISPVSKIGNIVEAAKSFVDDDNIAYYQFSTSDKDYVRDIDISEAVNIAGLKGTKLEFSILSSLELQSSDYLFQTIGTLGTSGDYSIINSNIVITGLTTGYSVTVPVRFIKYVP
jgi:hypothetical protein